MLTPKEPVMTTDIMDYPVNCAVVTLTIGIEVSVKVVFAENVNIVCAVEFNVVTDVKVQVPVDAVRGAAPLL
jgi:hypothetical protein